MKKLVAGILAHVDAGKTTLSEALLYRGGALRKLGRVDHKDAFLDTDAMERERGITIFSKQAELEVGELSITLLDTPGHVDFSAEMERTLRVLDCAILVVSGTDGVQGHTRTLWRLLERYGIPTVLFVNKMDLAGTDRASVLATLKKTLHSGIVDFSVPDTELWEEAAVCEEAALERFLETGALSDGDLTRMLQRRELFPCWFGSALKLEGVDALLSGLARFAPLPHYPADFGARVFKISRDAQGGRLTYLKITGGALHVKDSLAYTPAGAAIESRREEKADQIRVYSGAKFRAVESAIAGSVCAVTGLSQTWPGQGFGIDPGWNDTQLTPVLTYRVLCSSGTDPVVALAQLRQVEEEDPQLHVDWNEQLREIRVRLMGEVQLEILQRVLQERFGLCVTFNEGNIVYRETIAAPVEGVGHFEPLRHYAEVHLLLEPLERGSGLQVAADCPGDVLDSAWQRLILTHLEERTHLGVLTGSPITDMKLTLIAGRAHEKHTEGGDFRQATYRAVRQGLMEAESLLLEPWYDVRLELPAAAVGRAMSDLQRMEGRFSPPELLGDQAVLLGAAPVSALRSYAREVTAYTRGQGRLTCTLRGYEPCGDQRAVVEALGYDPARDVENPADSVFCAHGAGYLVPWDQVPDCAHVPMRRKAVEREAAEPVVRRTESYAGTMQQERELQAIFERTYGPVRRRAFQSPRQARPMQTEEKRTIREQKLGPEYLLVDGYNLIFAWDELAALGRDHLEAARRRLCDLLSNYQGVRNCRVIVVFDAYKVPGGRGCVERYHNIHVVYTKEAETADAYIEKATYEIGREHRVRVATSDGPEQLIILGHGALRVSASAFHEEVQAAQAQITAALERNNRPGGGRGLRAALEKAQENEKKTEE